MQYKIHDPYKGCHPRERKLLEGDRIATEQEYFQLLKELSEPRKVVMQAALPAPDLTIKNKPLLAAGSLPDRSLVLWPIVHSAADAGMYILAGVSVAFACKYTGFLEWARWVDIVIYATLLYFPALLADWVFGGNSSVLKIHTTPETQPVPVEAPPHQPVIDMETKAHTLRLEITQENGRLRHIVNVMPDGWDIDRMKAVCSAIKNKSMAFSQPVTKLSSHSFKKLKELWLERGLIELQSGYDDRYQLTKIGIELVSQI